ncbi:uncharacterized protein VP01_7709g1, partial [Puccinia sorghi]
TSSSSLFSDSENSNSESVLLSGMEPPPYFPPSFENIQKKWYPKICHHAPNIPLILVGTKLDLGEDALTIEKLRECRMVPILYQQAAGMARDIAAIQYLEC